MPVVFPPFTKAHCSAEEEFENTDGRAPDKCFYYGYPTLGEFDTSRIRKNCEDNNANERAEHRGGGSGLLQQIIDSLFVFGY